MVAALGNYGGVEIKKSTGGIQKTIPLFEVKEGDLSYAPSVEYFSTGIKVDDWGSHVGIGWTENLTAVISRVVRGVPDERATDRIGDGDSEFGSDGSPDLSAAAYTKTNALAVSGTTFDGEYDLFNYNIFGISGQFIIKGNQAVLLDKRNPIRIEIVQASPTYQFVVTDTNGIKYYFNSEKEGTYFNSDNACDVDNPYRYGEITTAWFINKMASPTGNEIAFGYEDAVYSYIYDYNESYIYYLESTTFYWTPFNGESNIAEWHCDNKPDDGQRNTCVRRKTTKTKRLITVTGDNFSVSFEYSNRNDIVNEKLLSRVTLKNNGGDLKYFNFIYDAITASSNFEPVLAANLENDPIANNGLKIRYFLNKVNVSDANNNIKQTYAFTYENPSSLPHRFSFSQDYLGYYNGKSNLGMVPSNSIDGLVTFDRMYPSPIPSFQFGNREPSTVGKAGLLSRITYPTGGKDDIEYEQNEYRETVRKEYRGSWSDFFENENTNTYSGSLFDIHVNRSGPVNLKLECYYSSEEAKTLSEDEYSADAELWSTSGRINWPDGRTKIELHLGSVFNSTSGLNPVYKLNFDPNEDYWLVVNINGKHTTLKVTVTSITDVTEEIVAKTYPGYRVKQVVTKANSSPDITKIYKYGLLSQSGDQLTLSDVSSLVAAPLTNFRAVAVQVCELPIGVGPMTNYHDYISFYLFTLMHRSNLDLNIYAGMPYIYKNVTEIQGNNQSSFVSSEYGVTADEYGKRVAVDLYDYLDLVSPDVEKRTWDTGLELKRLLGTSASNTFKIKQETRWTYSDVSSRYFNYSAAKVNPEFNYHFISPQVRMQAYIIKSAATYTHWTTLDKVDQIDYFNTGNQYPTIKNQTIYRYNVVDRQVEEQESINSKGETTIKQTFRPNKMVSLNRDPNGAYQAMIANNIIQPEVETVQKVNGSQISLMRTNYHEPFTGLFVPKSIETQQRVTSPVVTQINFLKYNSRGNVLSFSSEAGPVTNYIWAYKGQHPIARIDNMDYVSIENKIGTNNLNSFLSTSPTKADVDNFLTALKTDFPTTHISSFSFLPHIGMTSSTDVKGQTTYYEYDSFQRLLNIKDQSSKVLKHYEYHYQN